MGSIIDFENTDLKLLLADVLEELKEIIQAKNAIIKVSELPVLKALPLLMRQLFINLLSNALKYSKQNIVSRISISLSIVGNSEIKGYSEHSEHSEHSAKNYYRIKVTDNGIGFPEEQALKIFEPFKRLHAKDKYEGTGIGLAICKKIASKHKGFITANSILGQGATFNLYLPVS